jgi:uncharacterized protein YabN with tetrapyrrole methylase and pyrophosphatase domain
VELVYEKINEELDELKSAPEKNRLEEFGDLLFAAVNLGRHHGLDAEVALRLANSKFERRFAFIESELARTNKTPEQSDLAEMEELWTRAKAQGG